MESENPYVFRSLTGMNCNVFLWIYCSYYLREEKDRREVPQPKHFFRAYILVEAILQQLSFIQNLILLIIKYEVLVLRAS